MTGRRERLLAAELERVAAELRRGEARLYGYRVHREGGGQATPPYTDESGAIDHTGGWLEFRFQE
ncbi:MAG: hypothetical protein ABEJ06_04665 [Haloarculaceae archaeon]